jgi:hypothetical protein
LTGVIAERHGPGWVRVHARVSFHKKQQFAQYMKINSQIKIKYRLGVFLSPFDQCGRGGEDGGGREVARGPLLVDPG